MRILALSGSLRAASTNSALLRVAARQAPAGMEIELFDGLGALPLFNLDLEAELPVAVAELYENVGAADALLIASPEYAQRVRAVTQNADDWLVRRERFPG